MKSARWCHATHEEYHAYLAGKRSFLYDSMPSDKIDVHVITGSRQWTDVDKIAHCFSTAYRSPFIGIVGDAAGADTIAWAVLEVLGYPRFRFKPEWSRHGKAAGLMRNRTMLGYAVTAKERGHHVSTLAFWNGKSRGTQDCMDASERLGIPAYAIGATL